MKKYSIIIIYLFVCFACSETEHTPVGGNEEFIIHADVSTTVHGGEISRADPPSFTKKFDLFLTKTKPVDSKFGPEVYHAKYASLNYNVYNPSDEKLYWDNIGGINAELEFFGIHPKGKIKPDQLNFTVLSDQSIDTDDLDASDLKISDKVTGYTLRKQKGIDAPAGTANLTFRHLLSKITLVLTPKEGFEGKGFEPAPKLLSFNTTCSVDLASLSTENHGTPADITPKKISGENRIKTYTAIVVPGQSFALNNEFGEIKLDVEGTPHTYKLKIPKAITIAPGKNYLFEVTVNKSTTDIEASLIGWEEETVGTDNEVKIGFNNLTSLPNQVVAAGSDLFIKIDDGDNVHEAHYRLNSSSKWEYETTSPKVYWDDIKTSSAPKAKAVLLLETSPSDKTNPENIYVGESQELDKVYNYVQFKEMARPFCKINLTIKSLKEEKDTYDERVDLSKITQILSNGLCEFDNVNTTIADANFLKITYDETNNAEFGISTSTPVGDKDNKDNSNYFYYVDPLYIKPGQSFAKGAKLLDVTVQETASIVNIYPFKIPTTITGDALTFEASKEYNITIALKKTEIVDMEVSIVGWGQTSDIDGGATIDN